MATAADVPGKFDCVINGQGYVFLDSLEPSLPFRTHRAIYEFSPTFIPRQNVSGAYGDNTQMFWQTAYQHDWSLGEQQRFFRATDADRVRRYWGGTNIDIHTPGQVTLRQGTVTTTALTTTAQVAAGNQLYVTTTTNLWTVDANGTLTDLGAHGLGAAPSCLAWDGTDIYLSSSAAGSVGVRRYHAAAYTTFSAQKCDSLVFLNNSLYGLNNANGQIYSFSTAGAARSLFPWKTAAGAAAAQMTGVLRAYGSQLLIMWSSAKRGTELWLYSGSGTTLLAALPPNFYGYDIDVAFGAVFVGGSFLLTVPTGSVAGSYVPAVMYYVSGNYGELWRANSVNSSPAGTAVTDLEHTPVGYYDKGIVFADTVRDQLMLYDASTGAISSIADTAGYSSKLFLDGAQAFAGLNNRATIRLFHSTATVASGTVLTSLFDLESSLAKLFRAVVIDADIPAGASVDVAYQLNGLDGSYTSLATGITPGSEIPVGQQARSIGFKITLNKGSSAAGPTLKRIYVRAAPVEQQFRGRQYVLDLSGSDSLPRKVRDGSYNPKSGREQANDLITAASLTSPFSITDRFGTFTGLIDIDQGFEIYEVHPAVDDPPRSGTFVARVSVREV